MNYLWSDYQEKDTFCVGMGDPYKECVGVDECGRIEINPLLRFADIFLPILQGFENREEKTLRSIENLLFHILAHLDRTCGIHDFTLVENRLERLLETGAYGRRVQENFAKLDYRERRAILRLLRRQEATGGRILFYREALLALFPSARLYFYEDEQRFLIYLPEAENEDAKCKLKLAEDLFCDMSCERKGIFFQNHFGIIGVSSTMRIDHIRVY